MINVQNAKKATQQHENLLFCTKHGNKYEKFDIHKCECGKKASWSMNDKFLCNIHKKKEITTLCKQNGPKTIKKEINKDPQTVAETLYKKLDSIPDLINDIGTVLVENQLALTNPFIKTISVLLFAYFINKKISCVKFISAFNKLKIPDEDKIEIDKRVQEHYDSKTKKTSGVKTKAAQKSAEKEKRKIMAIIYTKYIFEKTGKQESKNHLDKYPKQDDLCDAYLQARKYVNK